MSDLEKQKWFAWFPVTSEKGERLFLKTVYRYKIRVKRPNPTIHFLDNFPGEYEAEEFRYEAIE